MPFELPFWPTFATLCLLHWVMGMAAAILARQKGLDFQSWLVKGLIGGTVAFVLVLRAQSPPDLPSHGLDNQEEPNE